MVSPDRIKHFIFIRFFEKVTPGYPYDVLSVDFLQNAVRLAQNPLGSLENQTNKNFEIVFFVNEKFFKEEKYAFIIPTLKNLTTIPTMFTEGKKSRSLVKKALNEYDFVIQSRLDYDDFVYKDAVADTQSKVNECKDLLMYGYCKGYSYLNGEILPNYYVWNGTGHHSILQSLILKSSFARDLPFILGPWAGHYKIKISMAALLKKFGIEFREDMFQQNLSTNAFIYFQHELATFRSISKKLPTAVSMSVGHELTSKDITKKQLAEEFAFHLDLNSIE